VPHSVECESRSECSFPLKTKALLTVRHTLALARASSSVETIIRAMIHSQFTPFALVTISMKVCRKMSVCGLLLTVNLFSLCYSFHSAFSLTFTVNQIHAFVWSPFLCVRPFRPFYFVARNDIRTGAVQQ
jgi:hypothetical protein